MPPKINLPHPAPEAMPGSGEALRDLAREIESTPTPERLKTLGDQVVTEAIPRIDHENTVPREQAEQAGKEPRRLRLFEALALALAYLLQKGVPVDQATVDRFMDVEDDTSEDIESTPPATPKARRQKARAERQAARGLEKHARGLVRSAQSLVGSTRFRGPEVAGGSLACAQVATTALVEAGYLKKPILSVSSTREELLRRGWTAHQGPGRAGDVVIWNRTQKATNDGQVQLEHAHIGIVVGPNRCVSNSSSKKMPREHSIGEESNDGYWRKRGVDTYLSPPVA